MSVTQARKRAERAVENGDEEIEYRGWFFTIEDHRNGWTYFLRGDEYVSLEAVFDEIDDRVRHENRRKITRKAPVKRRR
jgi:hypothetical protein